MKKIIPILISLLIVYSCSRKIIATGCNCHSVVCLLAGKQWIYDSVYYDYTGASTGRLVYARGSKKNILDYGGDDRFVFWADGTEDSFGGGNYHSFRWSFTGSDSTAFVVHNTVADYARILKLGGSYLTLYDSTNNALCYCVIKR